MPMSSIARPVASSASFLGHCSAASASALRRVLGARVHEYFVTGGMDTNEGAKVYGRNKPGI